jgi:hypothetical protein
MVPNTISGLGSLQGVGTLKTEVITYAIGSTGPGGGKVFYGDGTTQSWGRYIEADVSSVSVLNRQAWASLGYTNTSINTSTDIGTGLANTNAILSVDLGASTSPTSVPGALVGTAPYQARNFNGGGKSDWFLPNYNELYQLWIRRSTLGLTFQNATYWGSNQTSIDRASSLYGLDGQMYAQPKDNLFRCIIPCRYIQ